MSNKENNAVKITKNSLEEFKKLVRRAIMLTHNEEPLFNAIPNDNWEKIFARNFNGNFEYARRVLLNKFKEIEKIDAATTRREHKKIFNLDKSVNMFLEAIDKEIPIVFVTDFDNDGSLAQAIINEYREMDIIANKNIIVEYAQTVNGNASRGFTVDHIDLILKKKELDGDKEFLIVTADNGINSVEEQKKIMEKYPKAKLIVTDHHNPEPDMVVVDDERTSVFNPHFNPTPFFQKFNISGAATVGVLLEEILDRRLTPIEKESYSRNYEKLATLYKVSNLLDYVDTHPADKPEKDYIITKFLRLQPLLNINNSISKIITGEITAEAIKALEEKIPSLNVERLHEEGKNIHTQNFIAKVLLKVYNIYQKQAESNKIGIGEKTTHTKNNFIKLYINELNNSQNFIENNDINPNYIEQLRPLIFSLSADYDNDEFLTILNEKMVEVFESVRISEKAMAEELRRGEVITKSRLPNSVIAYADPYVLTVFNRKFLNKVYNDENPGFSLTLDNVNKAKVSGSFRSLYDISDILKDKKKLEKKLNVRIETPGHERAAGFIIRSNDPEKNPVTAKTIDAINEHIHNAIEKLKLKEVKDMKTYLLTDLTSIPLIDRINTVVRGNVSNFERVTPVLRLSPDTVWTDSYTTEQFTMEQICENKQYGYITVNINFHGNTVIVPVELVRKVVESGYKDYLSLSYMDGGVFMVERTLPENEVRKLVDLREPSEKTKELIAAYEQDFTNGNHVVQLTREQIKDNPFFKYNDYGDLDFDLFESTVIGVIDSNEVDVLSVFDVEANGFGNSKLMNIGFMNYMIDEKTGEEMEAEEFESRMFFTPRGEQFLLEDGEILQLRKISIEEKALLPLDIQKKVLINFANINNKDEQYDYYLPDDVILGSKSKSLPYKKVSNYNFNDNRKIVFNRKIKGEMLAYLVKDDDFLVPQEMINLTGITQELLRKYGVSTEVVDNELDAYFKDKNVLFGAHNTPYDARVNRANLRKFYKKLTESSIYDSALFAREQKLAYDSVLVASFEGVPGMPSNIYFYDNSFSDFNLQKFLMENKNGYYPDRTNRYLLEIEDEEYFLVDKEKHEKIRLDANQNQMLEKLQRGPVPNISVKYSVEKLSEQKMIHSLLLCDEKFDIQLVDLNKPEYNLLQEVADDLKFFQENYHFDNDVEANVNQFTRAARLDFNSSLVSMFMPKWECDNAGKPVLRIPRIEEFDEEIRATLPPDVSADVINEKYEEYLESIPGLNRNRQLAMFINEFMTINKEVQQKFADSWMYKQVLSIKDPSHNEINNDLIDLVNYQTSIPKEKIRTIYNDAIRFKKKYKIDHVLQHEMHANGPWRTDAKGDINFEDKLTFVLFAGRNYDSYAHSVYPVVRKFNEFRVKAETAFRIADKLSDETAQDSYSFRQAILYDRADETMTAMLQNLQEKEAQLVQTEGARIIKYKLDNDVLPQDACVYGVIKKGIVMDRELIEEHKKKIGFIILNKQLENSMGNNSYVGITQIVTEILKANEEKCKKYSDELMEFYSYLEFDRKAYQIKQVIDKVKNLVFNRKPLGERAKIPSSQIDNDGIAIIKDVVNKIVETSAQLSVHNVDPSEIDRIYSVAFKGRDEFYETPLEKAYKATAEDDFQREKAFFDGVDIKRQSPVDRLLDKHQDYRLVNQYIENKKMEFTPKSMRRKTM